MNKKGEEEELLTKEVINIIIAVLCIAILIALIVVVYFSVTGNQNSKYAEAIVNGPHGIGAEINRINSGGTDNSNFFVPNPSGWFIFSFTDDKKPDQCAGANCVCICQDVTYIGDWQMALAKNCDDKGACTAVQNLAAFDKIKIEGGGISISIKKVNGLIQIAKA